jgi:hypothetical protein
MFQAMNRQPNRPPVQSLKTAVTKLSKSKHHRRSQRKKNDESSMQRMNENGHARRANELPSNIRIPRWAEEDIIEAKRDKNSRASSRSSHSK